MTRAAVLGALALAGCSAPLPPPRADALPRIASTNPCSDAILAEVTAPGQLVAVSRYSRDPSQSSMDVALARRLAVADGTETVAAARPDLVIGSPFDGAAARGAYARMGIAYEGVGIAATVADSIAQVRRLASLAHQPARGEALVARIEAAVAAPTPPPVTAIVWQGGGLVAGDGTLVADLMRRSGFANAVAARGLGQGSVLGLERLVADPPQVIFVAGGARGRGWALGDRMLAHPVLAHLRGTRRIALDPALLWCGGPTIPRLAEALRAARSSL
ncbi:ABC transporter substrate-binding protein [Parablastomonas sp. CN1-191]|uniref:ABC transporter substrate-binding protein n=1 Tax=Parablastomonas sp. CN1-191 TaxID=3400908 RepID=UPI003BF88C69